MTTPQLLDLIDETIAEYEQWLARKLQAEQKWQRRSNNKSTRR